MMREPCQMNAVLLAGNGFCRFPLFNVEYLNRLVFPGSHQKVTLVVEI